MIIMLLRVWLVKSLLLCNFLASANIEQSLRVLQKNLKNLANSIRRPPKEIITEFKKSTFLAHVKGSIKKTKFSYYFKTEKDQPRRDSDIYQLIQDVSAFGLVAGDIFYIDMAHGDELEVFDAAFNSKTVLTFAGNVNKKGVESITAHARTLYGKPYNSTKIKKESSFNPFKEIDNKVPHDAWESTALQYRIIVDTRWVPTSLNVTTRELVVGGCTLPAKTLFYTKDKKIYKIVLGKKKGRELIDATVEECVLTKETSKGLWSWFNY